jgi:hypothetical protein
MGIGDNSMLCALDRRYFRYLGLNITRTKPPVDYSDSALFGQHNSHRGSRYRVHVCGNQGTLYGQVLSKSRRQIHCVGISAIEESILGSK